MNQTLFAASCVAAVLAATPLAAQMQSPATAPSGRAVTPSMPETVGTPPGRTIDEPSHRPAGRVSETAPTPLAVSGEARFRADLAACQALAPESQASCRREMHAARLQGLYRN